METQTFKILIRDKMNETCLSLIKSLISKFEKLDSYIYMKHFQIK